MLQHEAKKDSTLQANQSTQLSWQQQELQRARQRIQQQAAQAAARARRY